MSARAALDSHIETLQILAREGDTDRADAERDRDAAHRAKLIDAFAHELAEELRTWGEDGEKRTAVDEDGSPLHRTPFFMHEDADTAADLIDPHAGTARPGEEPTT